VGIFSNFWLLERERVGYRVRESFYDVITTTIFRQKKLIFEPNNLVQIPILTKIRFYHKERLGVKQRISLFTQITIFAPKIVDQNSLLNI